MGNIGALKWMCWCSCGQGELNAQIGFASLGLGWDESFKCAYSQAPLMRRMLGTHCESMQMHAHIHTYTKTKYISTLVRGNRNNNKSLSVQ